MKEHRILFRADGGKKTGLGHWSRCLFLASCIEESSQAILFTTDSKNFTEVFPESTINVQQINDEKDFLNAVSTGDLVILDDYKIESEYVSRLNERGAWVIYIDDLFKENIKSDVIINHCPGITAEQYKGNSIYTSFMLGSEYSLIAENFSRAANNVNRLDDVLVSMGGADPENNTVSILIQYADFFQRFRHVNIIVGGMYVHQEKLETLCHKHKNFKAYNNLTRTEVSRIMKESGIAIVSSSTMALEYAHVGGLLTIKKTADNQKHVYQGLISAELAIDMDTLVTNKDTNEKLYLKLSGNQARVFDGKSKDRFRKFFKDISVQQQIVLRKAVSEDLEITFQWATDETIRAFSFSKDKITIEGHEQWFQKKINANNCLYYIAFLKNNAVGSVRFDLSGDSATISYLVDPQHQGIGLGRSLLAEAMKRLLKESPATKIIVGYVMDENIPSLKIFEKLGFKRDTDYEPRSIKFYKEI